MKEKEIKDILRTKFQLAENKYFPDNWKSILNLFFNKVDYFNHQENLFSDSSKVIDGRQVGTVRLDNGKQLAIFTVEVADNISIIRNRQGLREIASKYIDQNIIHGSLAFFYNKKQADYRFSFIAKEASIDLETGELVKGETKPKRYTYLLGANEACTTAAKRFLVLADKKERGEVDIKQLKEVFSVEALNRDFFKTYKFHYEKFWKHLADEENPFRYSLIDSEKEDTAKQEKPIRDFVKKLLGRIVFLHFLQKKGWMGCSSSNIDWTDGDPRFMQQLFDDFENPSSFHSQCLVKLFFKTLNCRRGNDLFEVKNLRGRLNGSRVPYLNGGLFEPEKNKATLNIDFPPDFFKELLEFFEQYNFTIDENSPDDHEVGIDPEMLGHIFENLLEDNRDKGAFYTPKEIVQYMCQESLIQYLLQNFQEQTDIETFIRIHSVSPFLAEKENAILLNQKLDDIKVCDPAIGSGAFPIGILQEIFEAKRFIYPYLKTNKDFKPAEVKKNIIQNSIYGVDLEKGAVDIAQLRFWLSLVVDELTPHPLPNLDYKIMQGNSLLEKFEGIDLSQMGSAKGDTTIAEPARDLFGNLTEDQIKMTFSKTETINQIQKLIKQFFAIEVSEEKLAIREKINRLVLQHIEYNIELRENQLNRFISEVGNPSKLAKNTRKKYDGFLNQLEKLQVTKEQLLKIQETDERPYFLWHLYFMDVFEQGGFDVIIGNPPYIQLQKMAKETDILQESNFETFVRTGDIYCLFYEKGFGLLKNGGILSYITSNSWLRAKYGAALRKFFREKTNPVFLINFEDTLLFQSATVEANILIGQKSIFKRALTAVAIKADLKNASLSAYLKKKQIKLENLDDNGWSVAEPIDFNIKLKIEQLGTPLKNLDYQINYGIKTGFNDAFIISTAKRNELVELDPANDKIIKKFLSGRDLSKYSYKWPGTWLIFTKHGIDILKYPIIEKFLTPQYDNLRPKNNGETTGRKPGPYKWYEIQDNVAYSSDFEKPKLIWAELSDLPKFVYDDQQYYTNKTTFILTGENLKYLLLLLNSKLLVWYFSQISTSTGMGTTMWSKYKVEEVPIMQVSDTEIWKFERVANILLFLNSADEDGLAVAFEDLANMMVYEIYFREELKNKDIDVLQFVTDNAFPDITQAEDKKVVIQKAYYELQQKDNPIRNRTLIASSRSETIARINAATN